MESHNPSTYLEGQTLFIDKPLNWTSFDVVNKIRQSLRYHLGIKKIKVGHAGTLDPLATGLIIICTGKATKQISQFQDMDKTYEAVIRLGATTPSLDLETEVDSTFPWDHITRKMIDNVLKEFTGTIKQMPPVFSAKSVDGKRAYDLARKGKPVVLKHQLVTINKMSVVDIQLPDLSLLVDCSKGTYIRSLTRDIGQKLDSGAHLAGLRRTRIGPYEVCKATKLDNFIKNLKLL